MQPWGGDGGSQREEEGSHGVIDWPDFPGACSNDSGAAAPAPMTLIGCWCIQVGRASQGQARLVN